MVNITISGDGTFNKLNDNDLKDIAEYICSKNKDFRKVNIRYMEEDEKTITFKNVLEFHKDTTDDLYTSKEN